MAPPGEEGSPPVGLAPRQAGTANIRRAAEIERKSALFMG
jgi:hypothetical protein